MTGAADETRAGLRDALKRHGRRDPLDRVVDMTAAMRESSGPLATIVDPWAVPGAVTTIAGRPGEAKSWLAMFAAGISHGGGGDLAGMEVSAAKALLIDAENGRRILGRRFTAVGFEPDALVVVDGQGLRLPDDVSDIDKLIRHYGARFVLLDSLRRLAPKMREKESDDVVPVYDALAGLSREHDAAIVVLHHRSTKRHANDVRGSSAIEDQSDCVFVLERVAGDRDRQRRRLRCIKYRVDEEPSPVWFRLQTTAGFVSLQTCPACARPDDEDDAEGSAELAEELLLASMTTAWERLPEDGWRPGELAALVGVNVGSGTFKRALAMAHERGLVIVTGSTRGRRYRMATNGQGTFDDEAQ